MLVPFKIEPSIHVCPIRGDHLSGRFRRQSVEQSRQSKCLPFDIDYELTLRHVDRDADTEVKLTMV